MVVVAASVALDDGGSGLPNHLPDWIFGYQVTWLVLLPALAFGIGACYASL
jgi:hypothetical protein